MIQHLDLQFTNGSGFDTTKPLFLTNAQVQVQAPEGHDLQFSASGPGKVQLVVAKPNGTFPQTQLGEVITSSGEQMESCTVTVKSPSIEGVVVYVCGQNVLLGVDGCGQMILSLGHVEPLP